MALKTKSRSKDLGLVRRSVSIIFIWIRKIADKDFSTNSCKRNVTVNL